MQAEQKGRSRILFAAKEDTLPGSHSPPKSPSINVQKHETVDMHLRRRCRLFRATSQAEELVATGPGMCGYCKGPK